MATFLRSPTSPRPARTFYYDDSNPRSHTANNLSGATMSDLVSGSEDTAVESPSSKTQGSRSSKARQPLRTSSLPRHQRMQRNRSIVELLQDVQTELVSHRQIMLDMQSRLEKLEDASNNDNNTIKPPVPPKPARRKSTRTHIRTSEDLTRETQERWGACHNPSESSEQPSIATDFAYPTKRLSAFDFELLKTIPASPRTPLDDISTTDNIPPAYTPGNRRIPPRLTRAPASDPITMYHDAVNDIREHSVNFDTEAMPIPPILHTPPHSARSKTTAASTDNGITALPVMPPSPPKPLAQNTKNNYKGIKKLFAYKALIKSKAESDEKEGRRSFSSLRC